MGIKLIIIGLIVWFVFSIWRKFNQPQDNSNTQPSTKKMLSCSVCKIHIPENEMIIKNGKFFCSKKCLG
jgi:uncharacterized protein